MTYKTLVIGDLHGCYDELQRLLDIVPLTSEDHIVHIGDFLDRGPYPAQVIDFFRKTPNTYSILGNRDEKHILAFDGKAGYTGVREVTRLQFVDDALYAEAIEYLRTLPLYLNLPEALLVHGYFEPGVPVQDQRPDVLLGHESGESYLSKMGHVPWYQHYHNHKPIIVGHRDYPFLHYMRRVYAIDTRCVYGGTLTGLLLPDFVAYSVPAQKDHWLYLRNRYAALLEEK